jgi:hypothetical protein
MSTTTKTPSERLITVEQFVQQHGRKAPELADAFRHVERLAHPTETRKFAASTWSQLFAEFCSAPRG